MQPPSTPALSTFVRSTRVTLPDQPGPRRIRTQRDPAAPRAGPGDSLVASPFLLLKKNSLLVLSKLYYKERARCEEEVNILSEFDLGEIRGTTAKYREMFF